MKAPSKDRASKLNLNPARLLIGLFLIVYGLSLYADVSGAFKLEVDLLKLWPIFLIAVGISIIPDTRWTFTILKWAFFIVAVSISAYIIFSDTTSMFEHKKGARSCKVEVKPGVEEIEMNADIERFSELLIANLER